MLSKNITINTMNDWGRKNIPFMFIIDFEMQKPVLFKLDEIDTNELLFNMNGFTNVSHYTPQEKKVSLEKFPIPLENYLLKFNKIKENISAGNTYLLNLTCITPVNINLSSKEIFYRAKAKYKIWFKDEWVCFSPETFIRIKDGVIGTFPMKGTIDASVENAANVIIDDSKETAEHYTIVDLMRNDLNMVADHVRVVKFRYIEQISTSDKELLQVSSVIEGDLRKNYLHRLGDIIYSLLPAGSVSGAPKRKTTEIISETEGYQRGYYTGICGIFDGKNIDSCVLIRFIEKSDNGLIYKSGGGITSCSDPVTEYREMIDKVYVPIV
jgi:para-aminobenzoate synthetase component I